jgi:undecaprenyl diphosphate synthase
LPTQSVYADIYVVDAFWPDFEQAHLHEALAWFRQQDGSLGG